MPLSVYPSTRLPVYPSHLRPVDTHLILQRDSPTLAFLKEGRMARVIFWDVDTQYDFMKADGKLFVPDADHIIGDRKSTRLNSSHVRISYAVFCLKKKKKKNSM